MPKFTYREKKETDTGRGPQVFFSLDEFTTSNTKTFQQQQITNSTFKLTIYIARTHREQHDETIKLENLMKSQIECEI